MPSWFKEIRKAVVATAIAFVAALTTALEDGNVTQLEWVLAAGAALVALGAVWGVPNTPPEQG